MPINNITIQPFFIPNKFKYLENSILKFDELIIHLPRPHYTDLTYIINQLKENRFHLKLSIYEIINIMEQLGNNWLNPNYIYRKKAEQYLPLITGFSIEIIREGINLTFQEFNQNKLIKIYCNIPANKIKIISHFLAGNIFVSGIFGIVYGLLAQQPQIIKLSGIEPLFPILFAQSLYDINPDLASLLFILYWPGGDNSMESIIFSQSNKIIAYGNDETILSIKNRLPYTTEYFDFGHRFSFGIIGKEYLNSSIAQKMAYDISIYDQQGCLSPQFYFLESTGEMHPSEFSAILANEMEIINQTYPRGKLILEESALIQQSRARFEIRSIKDLKTIIHQSNKSTAWTVICLPEIKIESNCLNRFIFLYPYTCIDEIIDTMKIYQGKIQCIGLALHPDKIRDYKIKLNILNIARYCLVGEMQKPQLDEIHIGKPNPLNFY